MTVHMLKSGLAVCGAGSPGDWPEDDRWVAYNNVPDRGSINCPGCLEQTSLAKYYEDSEGGYHKLAEALLSDPPGHYTLAVTDSTIAYRFGVWTAKHKAVPSAWTGLGKKKLLYVELLAQRPGGFCFAYGEKVRPRCITMVLTMRDPFPGSPK